jgi:iron complex outermembrane recepter protein
MRLRAARFVVAASIFGLYAPARARAQECTLLRDPVAGAHTWAQPLARSARLHARGLDLRSAIEQVATSASLRLSYSEDLLPADRHVCASWDSVAAGDALVRLLDGLSLEPVVAGGNLVVLAPVQRPAPTPERPKDETPVVSLEPMVVTADVRAIANRSQPFSTQIIDRTDPGFASANSMASLLSGSVPGLWMWDSPANTLAQYGSLRGASSFGMTSPKIYIDGIEVANPLLLNRLSPDAIDRIEVIRGPQGSALYGANAIGGVTNIITRHPSLDGGAPRASLSTGFGLGSSSWASGGALEQDHSLGLIAGSSAKSAYLDLALGTTGAYVPDAFSRYFSANGSARLIGAHSVISGTLRLFAQEAGSPSSPLLDSIAPVAGIQGVAAAASNDLSLRQYTLGVQATYASSARWTHSLVAGFDGYTLDGVPSGRTPWLSPTDSALRAAGTNAIRGTLRASSMARLFDGHAGSASLTLAAEHSVLRQRGGFDFAFSEPDSGEIEDYHRPGSKNEYEFMAPTEETLSTALLQRTNTGLSAQLDGGFRDRLFLTGGLRVEHDGGVSLSSRIAMLPTIGGAFVAGSGPLSLKLRASWGKGIRWPQLPTRLEQEYGTRLQMTQPELAPEVQSGIEAGFDLAWKRALSLQVTRFDQTATGVIQQIGFSDTSAVHGSGYFRGVQGYGSIANRGWELQATARRGPLAVRSSLSLVDSRVSSLSGNYAGDLIEGDRMLAVPAKTLGLSASWTAAHWSTSMAAYRALDWINYDRLALARALADPAAGTTPNPLQLRDYWRQYQGNTHLRLMFTRELRSGMTLLFSGDNLLNLQVGEPDNITIVPGRTFSLGLRASFF